MTDKLGRPYVALNAAIWGVFGLGFLVLPETFAAYLGIELQSPTAFADFRAIYGGMPLGVGVFFVMGWRCAEWFKPALMLILLGTGGIIMGRLISLAGDADVMWFIYAFLGMEVVLEAVGIWLYRNLGDATAA